MRDKIVPIASVIVGVIAFILTSQYLASQRRALQRERERLYEGATQIKVIVAAHDIPSGTVLKQEDLGKMNMFKSSVGDRAVMPEQAEMLVGKRTLFKIQQRDPVFWSDIAGGSPDYLSLASTVQHGMRALSLQISGAAAVSSMVQPNDRVDVLGTFQFPSKEAPGQMESVTITVLQDVTVLATGQTMAKQQSARMGRNASGYSTVTLEVTPKEAELLVFAQQSSGRLTLSLRNTSDVSFEKELPSINFSHIENHLPEMNLNRQRNIRRKRNI